MATQESGAAARGHRFSFAARPPAARQGRSRMLRWLRLLLPALAAAILGLLIVWPQLQQREAPRTAVDMADDVRLLDARYVGVDAHDRPFTVAAESAREIDGSARRLDLERPQADMTLGDGAWVAMLADHGIFDRDADVLSLEGNVRLFHDKGYQFRSQSARLDLKAGSASGDEPVTAQGPAGILTGEGFRIEDHGRRIVLTGHATMQLNPGALKRTGPPETSKE